MNALNWPRIVLCGLVTGVAFTVMSVVLVGVLGQDFLAAVSESAVAGTGAPKTSPALYLLTVAAGVWAMWLYSVIRPGSASNIGASVVVGLAWWVIASLQSLKWIALLGIHTAAWLPLTLNAVLCVIAASIGAFLFGAVQPKQLFQATPDGSRERQ
jgi:hypothetical protein